MIEGHESSEWASPLHYFPSYHEFQKIAPNLKSFSDYREEKWGEESYHESLFNYAFQQSNTKLGDLTQPSTLQVLCGLVLVLSYVKGFMLPFFCSVGRRLARRTHGKGWEQQNEEKIVKFGEYLFRLLYHIVITSFGVYYFWDRSWWNESLGGTKNLWNDFGHQVITPGMTWYYLIQATYHVENLLHLLKISFRVRLNTKDTTKLPVLIEWRDTVRGDFTEMACHHVFTNILVFGSSFHRTTPVGTVVFLLHDASDIMVDMSKLANFMKWKGLTAFCFVSLLTIWIALRLIYFPFYVINSVFFESHLASTDFGSVDHPGLRMYLFLANTLGILLSLLFLLHIHWTLIMLRIAGALFFKGERHDYTEHKNGEKDS